MLLIYTLIITVSCIVRIIHFSSSYLRSKNTVNILIKNMLDALLGGLTYWMIGWGVAYGTGCTNGVCTNGFIGSANYFSYNMDSSDYPAWFFQFVFAATAATIVSGAIAERCQFFAYFVYSIVITGTPLGLFSRNIIVYTITKVPFIKYRTKLLITVLYIHTLGWVYPVQTHWSWADDGWMKNLYCNGDNCLSYADFAGSGVVHVFGATCALIGCYFIGPRDGRFPKDGKAIDIPGHSVPLASLGGFILLFGFLAFNGGSQVIILSERILHLVNVRFIFFTHICVQLYFRYLTQLTISNEGDAAAVGRAIVNTIIGGCGGGLSVLFVNKIFFNKVWSYLLTLNGALTGMVAMCAGCNVFEPWAALLVGVFSGAVFTAIRESMNR